MWYAQSVGYAWMGTPVTSSIWLMILKSILLGICMLLLAAELQRAELISMPKASLASDHRIWNSVVHFFCLSSAPQERKWGQPRGFPCSPGLQGPSSNPQDYDLQQHREGLFLYFHAPQSLPLRKHSGDHFKSTLAKKCLYTEKHFCELLMAASQLICVKESWATDESGSNKMICKRPHSKQQGGREPGTKSMPYCAWFCQCKNPMPECKIHHFLCSKSRQRDEQKWFSLVSYCCLANRPSRLTFRTLWKILTSLCRQNYKASFKENFAPTLFSHLGRKLKCNEDVEVSPGFVTMD